MSQQEQITVQVADQYILARIHCAELDEEHSFRIEDELRSIAKKATRRPLILDLSEVSRMPGESLGAFVDLLHQCRDDGRRLILAGLQPQVLEIMSLTKLGRLFEYRDDAQDAIAHLMLQDDL
jgi:anti-anti-sigma factor